MLKSYPCYRAPLELPILLGLFFELFGGVLDKNVKFHEGVGILSHRCGKNGLKMGFVSHWSVSNGVSSHGVLGGLE